MIAALVLTALTQAPKNIPADAEIVYPLMPRYTAIANEDGEKVVLYQSIHGITLTLGKEKTKYESLSLFKNTTSFEGDVEITVAFESYRSGFGKDVPVKFLWSDEEVEPFDLRVRYPVPEKGQLGLYALKYRVTVKKEATHSLRIKHSLPVGVSGIDREERLVAYRVMDIKQTKTLEQFRLAVKYDGKTVFVPISSLPKWGWQVGDSGAYLKMDGNRSNRDSILTFRYYPAGF